MTEQDIAEMELAALRARLAQWKLENRLASMKADIARLETIKRIEGMLFTRNA